MHRLYLNYGIRFIIFILDEQGSMPKKQEGLRACLKLLDLHGSRRECTHNLIQCKTVECNHSFCYRCLSKWTRVPFGLCSARATVPSADRMYARYSTRRKSSNPNFWRFSIRNSVLCRARQFRQSAIVFKVTLPWSFGQLFSSSRQWLLCSSLTTSTSSTLFHYLTTSRLSDYYIFRIAISLHTQIQ